MINSKKKKKKIAKILFECHINLIQKKKKRNTMKKVYKHPYRHVLSPNTDIFTRTNIYSFAEPE